METRIRPVRHGLVLAVALLAAPSIVFAQGACADRLPLERITLNLRDANVQTTLRLLAQQYRVNMIVTDEVKKNGFGAVDMDRLDKSVEQIALTYQFKNAKPKGADVFDASFLPDAGARKAN